jgi:predicted acyltransferase (DUF342 family)
MTIPIITRTKTIDEWRIQTNQSAAALNSLETGTYTKSNGTLIISDNSSLVITANGTALQVSNNALFQRDVTISRDVAVGVRTSTTGNVQVGAVLTVLGPGNSLLVANSATVNANVIVGNTLTANDAYANNNVYIGRVLVVGANTTTGNLTSNNSITGNNLTINTNAGIGSNLIVGSNTSTSNLVVSQHIQTDTLRTLGRVDVGGGLSVSGPVTLEGDASVGGNFGVFGDFEIKGNLVYDAEILTISSNVPVTLGYAYIGVNRGNTTSQLGTTNANAYIRWSGFDNQFEIRDVNNSNNETSYSKILTSNLISSSLTSNSTVTIASSASVNLLNTAIITANSSMKQYVDANVLSLITGTNSSIVLANSAMKQYVDDTFVKLVGGTISGGDLFISGNLSVSGNNATINTQQLNVADNVITLNSDLLSNTSPTENAGLEINRGSSNKVFLLWNETTDRWTFTNDGTNYSNVGSASAELYANAAYSQANTATTSAATADQKAVSAGSYANSSFLRANTADQRAVTSGVYANSAYIQANTATTNAATADQKAVSAGSYANSAYAQANTATTTAVGLLPSGTTMLFVQTAAPTGWTKSTAHDNKALRVVSGTASSGGSLGFTSAFASRAVSGSIGGTTLTADQIPNHSHTFSASATTGTVSSDHVHSGITASQNANHGHSGSTDSQGSHTHNVPLIITDGDDGRYGVNGGFDWVTRTVSTQAAGAHNHNISTGIENAVHQHSFSTGGISANHNHSVSVSGTTSALGGSASHTHSFTGTAIDLSVQYVDAIIATKN